ncbi:MAG: 3-oxoacyl-ACP synthase [Alphaproteobacteria bacterium RIFCSPLOWO2_01_FULL_40_26]|nr:MAG: 3-oxoacyl-ACP synthase [Alphaproteobacteria bacterium RIFCSPHIGHO2_02_FULL_40_34]OFW93952.1 MAG: 3-oxoacyl-ACP synthase [Alphaproteobacteria bacterium RIFCSPLOWO2_01_FULL_40_26]OFX09664.1 MAG: 3-oxoacyl-ACP synthase [Alphaproteobacteria bacterium RIFCSPLOWO2_02_FULL_40_19]OFX11993.1 MAG: 3-oxoacyl-ACP synthase [Alphaproteobacteria bacterium RIFCSPLOWO2_12_FULL_40_11]
MMKSQITATGSYLPQKILTNSDLEKIVETTDEWIVERTGIKQRHIADEKELTSDLAVKAAQNALKNRNIKAEEIGMIIVATTTPDFTFPATATIVQSKIGARNAFAFDIQAVCSGFVFALACADNFIKSGQVKNALIIGAETLSRIVDWKDRNTCVLFGDGAGAVLLEATSEENRGIIATDLHSDGSLNNILKTSGGVAFNQKSGFIEMAGKEVFKHAVEKMTKSAQTAIAKAGLTIDNIDFLIPHQANLRILNSVANHLKLTPEKVIITVHDHANTSAASIPIALDCTNRNGKIKKDNVIVLEALGGGLTWGSIVLRW